MISKELLNRCLNPEFLCLAKLREKDREAYEILVSGNFASNVEVLDKIVGNNPGIPYWLPNNGEPMFSAKIYRLSPDTPVAPKIIELPVVYGAGFDQAGMVCVEGKDRSPKRLYTCLGHPRCRGFVYEIDGERKVFGDLNVLRGKCVAVKWETSS